MMKYPLSAGKSPSSAAPFTPGWALSGVAAGMWMRAARCLLRERRQPGLLALLLIICFGGVPSPDCVASVI